MHCQNVNRKQNDNDGPVNKKIKRIKQKHVYTNFEEEDDDIASARNDELLRKEISTIKPKIDTIKTFIKRTWIISAKNLVQWCYTRRSPKKVSSLLKKFNYVF